MIDVVIVTYDSGELIDACLDSVAAQGEDVSVVVVDNASHDDSAARARRHPLAPRVVENAENVGFARAVNQGVPLGDAPLVLLLNPDTTMRPGTLAGLRAAVHGDVVAVGPEVVHPEGRLRVLSAGRQPTPWRMWCHYSGASRLSARRPWLEGWHLLAGVHDDRDRDVEWVSGACLLVSRERLAAVGGLSERWFMYAEDLDLCDRLRAAGGRVRHLPGVRITHLVAASSDVQAGPVSTMWLTSTYDYVRLRFAPGRAGLAAWRWAVAAGMFSRSAVYAVRALRGEHRSLWRREARKFAQYGRAALALRRST